MAKKQVPKRQGGITRRPVGEREVRQRFLIVCEGEQTEPNYFRSFDLAKELLQITVRGVGMDTVALVREAMNSRDAGDYDQVWCVFDRDSFPADHFNRALALAATEGIHVAYSNEAFELWYLLHFHYYTTQNTRADYISKLSSLLGRRYEKNDASLYEELRSRQRTAIDNARRLLAEYNPCNPERDKPSTTVHLLVEQLLRFER